MQKHMGWEPVIGLEVHAQLLTRTKIFCSCGAVFGAPPNTHVCPVCLGLPGALPVLNGEAVAMAVRAALALGCTIREESRFARKNYFYPDLPKGYQISQFEAPFAEHGHLDLDSGKKVRIRRVHMEEDAGKNLHGRGGDSIVDLNRAGTPLVEIVSEPDLRSAQEAAEYLKTLRDILVFLGVNDGNLEEGSFRCDANVSIRPAGTDVLGTRVELKNINSFRFVEKAIEGEIARQEALDGAVQQETRGWDEKAGTTFSLRSKEEAEDYRYFPEPDLPPLVIGQAFVAQQRAASPELPRDKRARMVAEMHLTPYAAQVMTTHPRVSAFFEEAAMLHGDGVRVANFVQSEVLRDVTTRGLSADIPVTPKQIADLLKLVDQNRISGKQAKEVYAKVKGTDRTPEQIVAESGMAVMADEKAIEALVRRIVDENPKQAEQLKAGKASLTGFFVGQVMKATGGKANPAQLNELLKKKLAG
jgi:aspartyl-tRNA(Asn)/glutamyl-tRNA(Gln) amidotransferase subunit B